MKLATQLKKLLKKKGLSVAQVSRATNVSSKKLYSWLNGSHPSSFDDIYLVVKYLETTFEYLLFDEYNNEKRPSITDFTEEINLGQLEIILRKPKT